MSKLVFLAVLVSVTIAGCTLIQPVTPSVEPETAEGELDGLCEYAVRVLDSTDNDKIEGAFVTLSHGLETDNGRTDSEGEYRSKLPCGESNPRIDIRVEADGYVTYTSGFTLVGEIKEVYLTKVNTPTPTVPEVQAPSSTPTPLQGDFNVAVAEFGEQSAQGSITESRKGKELAEQVFTVISDAVREFQTAGFKIDVRPPSQIGRIHATNTEDIPERVEELANEINADLVIYGTLTFDDGATNLAPEFYLSNRQLQNAEELGGQYDLSKLSVDGNIDRNPVANRDMRNLVSERAAALAQFVIGLGYFSLEYFEDADRYFEESADYFELTDQETDINERSKAVIYLFRGSTNVLLNKLALAEEYYEKSRKLDDSYARARLGLAQISFLRAKGGCQPGQVDKEGVEAAIEQYEKALGDWHPPHANIPTKVALLKGRAYLCLISGQIDDHWTAAREEYKKVLDHFDAENDNARVKNLAAEASADLGLLLLLETQEPNQQKLRDALEKYTQAVELSTSLDRQAIFSLNIAKIQAHLGDCDSAQDQFIKAEKLHSEFGQRNLHIAQYEYDKLYIEIQSELSVKCEVDP